LPSIDLLQEIQASLAALSIDIQFHWVEGYQIEKGYWILDQDGLG
jgi:hypothetical protein